MNNVKSKKIKKFIICLDKYTKSKENEEFGRYKSLEHCYKVFYDAKCNKKPDYDYLTLNLAYYLAS